MKKFLIEFFVDYDLATTDLYKRRHRIENKARSIALNSFLFNDEASPYKQYGFNGHFQIVSHYDDCRKCYDDSALEIFRRVISSISSSPDEYIIIHFWGHADKDGMDGLDFKSLCEILANLKCKRLFLNLMNSCYTAGIGDYLKGKTTAWVATDRVPACCGDDYDALLNDIDSFRLSNDDIKEFTLPFMIYEYWDESKAWFDFDSFKNNYENNSGIQDLFREFVTE